MRRILTGVCLLVLMTPVYAVSESKFVYGYTLEVDGDGAIYSLILPEAVYHGLTRADRGDLRVYNSEGVAVPHHIMRAEQLAQKNIDDAKLPLFPLYMDTQQNDSADENQVHVVTNDKGQIIDINYGKLSGMATKRISAYLLDCSQLASTPNALIVNWPDSKDGFVINVEVAGSDDLTHWRPVIASKTLSDLPYEDHTLVQRRIDLPLHQYKYLRLSWLDGKSLQLDSVDAQFPATYQSQDRQWSSFKVTDTIRTKHTFYFDTHSVLPADRVNIGLPGPNTLVRVSLASSAGDKGPWRVRYQGLVYDLKINGDSLSTQAQVMDVNTDRYWRLRILNHNQSLQGNPVLRLGWIPEKLYFIARGEAPFTLAYGSARVEPSDTPLAQLLKMNTQQNGQQFIKPAQLGSSLELGNRGNLQPAGSGARRNDLIVWLIVILAIASLAAMGLYWYKQMDRRRPNE